MQHSLHLNTRKRTNILEVFLVFGFFKKKAEEKKNEEDGDNKALEMGDKT